MTDWQPIETAPKIDVKSLILWHPTAKRPVEGWWSEDKGLWSGPTSDFMAIPTFENGVQPEFWLPWSPPNG